MGQYWFDSLGDPPVVETPCLGGKLWGDVEPPEKLRDKKWITGNVGNQMQVRQIFHFVIIY